MAMNNPPHPGRSIRENCLDPLGLNVTEAAKVLGVACRSRIRHQAAAGSWTMPRQWEIQRTWLNSARAAVRSPAKPNGV